MLAPDGRCKALDAAADGYVRAEAAASVVLRAVDSLTAAATESGGGGSFGSGGGAAAVLLLGTAVNQDGRSSSLTAPNGPSQQALIRTAVAAASLPATRLNLLSMHGTGTSLGDPIEVGAALAVLMHKRKGGLLAVGWAAASLCKCPHVPAAPVGLPHLHTMIARCASACLQQPTARWRWLPARPL